MSRLFAVLAVLVVAMSAPASDCRRVSHVPSYVAPVVVHGHDYHQQVVIVPKAIQVVKALDSYASTGDEFRQAYFAKLVAEEYAKIVELQRQQLNLGPAPTGPVQPPIPPAKESLSAPKAPKIAQILKDRCASCHSEGKTAPNLAGDPDRIDETTRLRSFLAVAEGVMPKGKPSLPQEEFNELAAWAKAGNTAKK